MNKIKAIIIDDEKRARNLLNQLITASLGETIEIIGEAGTIDEAYHSIVEKKPDLLFLDIQIHNETGFDLLKRFENPSFEVIFVTAYDKYAIEAFQFSAFGYILKPIQANELRSTIGRLTDRIEQKQLDKSKLVKVLIENYGDDGRIKKLVINNIEGFKVLKLENIIRLEGDRNYTNFILTEGKKVTTSKSLGEYEKMLNDHGFFRIHQSTMVNLRHVTAFERKDGGYVEMSDEKKCKVSRQRKDQFLARFN